jgi:hypothetical protein
MRTSRRPGETKPAARSFSATFNGALGVPPLTASATLANPSLPFRVSTDIETAVFDLVRNVRAAFLAPDSSGMNEIEGAQARYVLALGFVADAMAQLGAGSTVEQMLGELALAIDGLGRGESHPIFTLASNPRGGRALDRADIWRMRAVAVAGVNAFVQSGIQVKEAAKDAARDYPGLARLKRPGTDLAGSLKSWRNEIDRIAEQNPSVAIEVDRLARWLSSFTGDNAASRRAGNSLLRQAELRAASLLMRRGKTNPPA